MPDIFLVMARRWSLMLLLTLAGTAAACIASLLSPKLYLGEATALPANSVLNDKSRLFNPNIEGLYPEIGSADELDKIEGTATLDTVFLSVAATHRLAAHYNLDTATSDAVEKAALLLKRKSSVAKTGYGELKVKVWDQNNAMAAALSNDLLQTLNAFYQNIQNANNAKVLQQLQTDVEAKQAEIATIEEQRVRFSGGTDTGTRVEEERKTSPPVSQAGLGKVQTLQSMVNEEQKLILQYELASKTATDALLVVENARPALTPDRPNTVRNVVLAFLASLLFSFLLAVFVESRKTSA